MAQTATMTELCILFSSFLYTFKISGTAIYGTFLFKKKMSESKKIVIYTCKNKVNVESIWKNPGK